MKTRQELQNDIIMRRCVCGHNCGLLQNGTIACPNKTCVWWNICTAEHSTPYTQLDQLYEMVYDRGICECEHPKQHEIDGKIVEDYFSCVNTDCWKVLREYKVIVVDQRLYQ